MTETKLCEEHDFGSWLLTDPSGTLCRYCKVCNHLDVGYNEHPEPELEYRIGYVATNWSGVIHVPLRCTGQPAAEVRLDAKEALALIRRLTHAIEDLHEEEIHDIRNPT